MSESDRPEHSRLVAAEWALLAENERLRAEVAFLTSAAENAMLRRQFLDARAKHDEAVKLAWSALSDLASHMRLEAGDKRLVESAMDALHKIPGIQAIDDYDFDDE